MIKELYELINVIVIFHRERFTNVNERKHFCFSKRTIRPHSPMRSAAHNAELFGEVNEAREGRDEVNVDESVLQRPFSES